MKRILTFILVVMVLLFTASMVSSNSAKDGKMEKGMDMETAKASFEEYCSKCHDLNRALSKQKDKDGWERTVSRMSGYHKRSGGPIPEDIEDAIVQYLVNVAGK